MKSEAIESVEKKPTGSKGKLGQESGKKTRIAGRRGKREKESKLEADKIFPAEVAEKAKETKEADLIVLDDEDEDEEDEEMNEIIEKYIAEQKKEEVEMVDLDEVLVIDEIRPDEQVNGCDSVPEEKDCGELRSRPRSETEGLQDEPRMFKSKTRRESVKKGQRKTKLSEQGEVKKILKVKWGLKINKRKEKEDKRLKKEAKKLEKKEQKRLGARERVERKKGKLARTIKLRMETVRL